MAKKKKKRVLKIKNICIFIGILILIIGLIYYILTMPIKNIYIKGNNIISDNEIIDSTNLYQYPSFILTTKKSLIKSIKKNPYIKSVNVNKKLGNVIEIKVEEYLPISITNDDRIIIDNGTILENSYNLMDLPIISSDIEDKDIYSNFTNKFSRIDSNILRQISQIEYSPIEVDKDRFLLYMNDTNLVYITLTKMDKLNKYNKIKDVLEGRIGIIYLDSGNYVELKNT